MCANLKRANVNLFAVSFGYRPLCRSSTPIVAMWRVATAARLLLCRCPNPSPRSPSVLLSSRHLPAERAPLHVSPNLPKATRLFAALSPAEAAVEPLGSISKRAGDVSEAVGHYARCYWELSKAHLR